MALCGCRAARMAVIILLRRKTNPHPKRRSHVAAAQGHVTMKCQSGHFISVPFPSSCLPLARAKVALVLGRRSQISSWQIPPRVLWCPLAGVSLEKMGANVQMWPQDLPTQHQLAIGEACLVPTPGAQFSTLGSGVFLPLSEIWWV